MYGYNFVGGTRRKGLKKCELTDVFMLFEGLCLSAASGEMCLIKLAFCCLWVEFMCHVGAWMAQLNYYSFFSESVFGRCSDACGAEQFPKRP